MALVGIAQPQCVPALRHLAGSIEILDGAVDDDEHDQRLIADDAPGIDVADRLVDVRARTDTFAAVELRQPWTL